MTPGNTLSEWARLLLVSLEQAGIRDAVLSPGSRSTPFTHAALRHTGMRCHSVVDERDAAFWAVGHARMTGRPVLLVCTSGSAAANYYPAVVEAARSGTPLVVLSADRPHELQQADAPQTIDQVRLYGDFARGYFDPGVPDAAPASLRALQRIAAQAVHRAGWPEPGPVHIDARARKPLEPVRAEGADAAALTRAVDTLIGRGVTRAGPAALPTAAGPAELDELAGSLAGAGRGLIVCGPVAPWLAPPAELVLELARRTGFALLPEATSQQRFAGDHEGVVTCDAFDTLLRCGAFRDRLQPDVVLEIGTPATSTGWRDYVAARPELRRHVLHPFDWADPHGGAATMWVGPLEPSIRALLDALGRDAADPDRGWLEDVARATATGWQVLDELLAAGAGGAAGTGDGDGPAHGAGTTDGAGTAHAVGAAALAEGAAIRAVVDALPAHALLAVGNSLPVREVDVFCRADSARVAVWHQRGAAGIDGLIAGAAGAAAAAGRPTALLLGDVSFLHDIGGLAAASALDVPLAIVVLDNQGGRIFEQLPLAGSGAVEPADWRYWSTPPAIDFAAAAATFSIPHLAVDRADSVAEAIRTALARSGPTVVEVALDGDRTVPFQRELRHRLEERLSAERGASESPVR